MPGIHRVLRAPQRDLCPVDQERPVVRRQHAREDLQERRLARAIVADEPEDFVAPERERGVGQRDHGAEAAADVPRLAGLRRGPDRRPASPLRPSRCVCGSVPYLEPASRPWNAAAASPRLSIPFAAAAPPRGGAASARRNIPSLSSTSRNLESSAGVRGGERPAGARAHARAQHKDSRAPARTCCRQLAARRSWRAFTLPAKAPFAPRPRRGTIEIGGAPALTSLP